MRRGNVHDAIKLLTDYRKNDIVLLTEKILQHLKQKHLPRCNADAEVLIVTRQARRSTPNQICLIQCRKY